MILRKIKMINFRQYNGEHVVEFAEEDKNITLILGENNAGKTGIYRALIFCLYGERLLAQDDESRKVHLVNFNALKEKNNAETSVSVEIEKENKKYIITRKLQAARHNKKIIEAKDDKLYLDLIDENGEYHKNYRDSKAEIEDIINMILDKNIKEFFLFDGEKIETLARADKDSRKEVKQGIIRLMNIDKLESVNTLINNIYREQERELRDKASNNEITEVSQAIEKKELRLEKIEEILDEKEENVINLNTEIKVIEARLKETEELRQLLNEKESYEKELKNYDEKRRNLLDNLVRYNFSSGIDLLLKDNYYNLNLRLERELLNKKDLIPEIVLKKSLENNNCLCCDQNIEDQHSIDYLENLINSYQTSENTTMIEVLSKDLNRKLGDIEEEYDNLNHSLRFISDIEIQKREINNKIRINRQKTSEMIEQKGEVEVNIPDFEEARINLLAEINMDKNSIEEYKEEKTELIKELAGLNHNYNKLMDLYVADNYEKKRLVFIKGFKEKIDIIYKKYINNTRKELSVTTTEAFKELIDDKDLSLVKEIRINNNYELDIFNEEGLNVTQDISQGQQMIVSLSFITSMGRLASKSESKVDYPLFMDTPFGRLSAENRKNLIDNLPRLSNQWIPLLTDTDLTPYEEGIFKSNDKVGKVYSIKKLSENESIIIDKTDQWEA